MSSRLPYHEVEIIRERAEAVRTADPLVSQLVDDILQLLDIHEQMCVHLDAYERDEAGSGEGQGGA